MSKVDFGELRQAAMDATFNPAYRVSRCGQQSAHGPHVVESGPDQPRNCPGGPAWSWSFVSVAEPADEDDDSCGDCASGKCHGGDPEFCECARHSISVEAGR